MLEHLRCASHPARHSTLQMRKIRLREPKKITEGQTRSSGRARIYSHWGLWSSYYFMLQKCSLSRWCPCWYVDWSECIKSGKASFCRKVTAAFSLTLCIYGYHQLLSISVLSEKYFVLFTCTFLVNTVTCTFLVNTVTNLTIVKFAFLLSSNTTITGNAS